jgi:hypothetical protein
VPENTVSWPCTRSLTGIVICNCSYNSSLGSFAKERQRFYHIILYYILWMRKVSEHSRGLETKETKKSAQIWEVALLSPGRLLLRIWEI